MLTLGIGAAKKKAKQSGCQIDNWKEEEVLFCCFLFYRMKGVCLFFEVGAICLRVRQFRGFIKWHETV